MSKTSSDTLPASDLTLNLYDDAWQGSVEFVLYINGKAVTTSSAQPGRDTIRSPRRLRPVKRLQGKS